MERPIAMTVIFLKIPKSMGGKYAVDGKSIKLYPPTQLVETSEKLLLLH